MKNDLRKGIATITLYNSVVNSNNRTAQLSCQLLSHGKTNTHAKSRLKKINGKCIVSNEHINVQDENNFNQSKIHNKRYTSKKIKVTRRNATIKIINCTPTMLVINDILFGSSLISKYLQQSVLYTISEENNQNYKVSENWLKINY